MKIQTGIRIEGKVWQTYRTLCSHQLSFNTEFVVWQKVTS